MGQYGRLAVSVVNSEDQIDVMANLQDFIYLNQSLYKQIKEAREDKWRASPYELNQKYQCKDLIQLLRSLALIEKCAHCSLEEFCAKPLKFHSSSLDECGYMCHICIQSY